MRAFKFLTATACSAAVLLALPLVADAQVSINIGLAPDCPYGYYDLAPYSCAPAGYYGPEWFNGDVFLGAGPWFRGAEHFRGNVNNRFHPDHGYAGPMPNRGERPEPARRVDRSTFHGNEERDGRGHASGEKR
jgi:hypothetical protein